MRGLGLVIYGPTGIGKTHFSLFFPKPMLYLNLYETGFDDLKIYPGVPEGITDITIAEYPQLISMLKSAFDGNHFKTIVIDSLSGFQQLFFDFLIKQNIPSTRSQTYKEAESAFWAFYRGPRKEAPNHMPGFTNMLSALLTKGINVVIIGHKTKDNEFNEAGADYARAVIDMDEGVRNCMLKWAPNIIYMSMQPNITQTLRSVGSGNQAVTVEGKTDFSGNKLIYTQTNAQNDSKNKLGLPPVIPILDSAERTFNAFWELLPPAFKG